MFKLSILDKQEKITKSLIHERASVLSQKVDNGEITAPNALLYLKMVEEAVKEARSAILDKAIEDVEKWDESKIELHGVEISVKQSASRYDYSEIPAWKEKKEELKAIEELAKQAANAYEKKQVGNVAMVDEETGEQIQPAKKLNGKETIQIKFPKE